MDLYSSSVYSKRKETRSNQRQSYHNNNYYSQYGRYQSGNDNYRNQRRDEKFDKYDKNESKRNEINERQNEQYDKRNNNQQGKYNQNRNEKQERYNENGNQQRKTNDYKDERIEKQNRNQQIEKTERIERKENQKDQQNEIQNTRKQNEKREINEQRQNERKEKKEERQETKQTQKQTKRKEYKQQEENEKQKLLEDMKETKWKGRKPELEEIIHDVEELLSKADKNEYCDEMCPLNDLLNYLRLKQFQPFEVDENNIPDIFKIVKPYARSTSERRIEKYDVRSVEGLAYSMKFLMEIIDDERYSNTSDDDKFSYISDRIRAIHTDIIRGNYHTRDIYMIIQGAIKFYAYFSFKINPENYKFAKEQMRQWILTLQDIYQIIDENEFDEITGVLPSSK